MITTSHLKRKPKAAAVVTNTTTEMTPPMTSTSRSRSSSISSFDDFDEDYFSKTYVPLSSLPTPPPSSHSNNSCQQLPESLVDCEHVLQPELLGPSIHLANLIPSSTSLATPSVPLVHAILTRADLPLETIALAVCILDSLNSRFALQWRKNCPLVQNVYSSTWTDADTTSMQHIDSVHPEIIVLSALVLAVKFCDDAQQKTKEYAEDWGKGLWTCDQINYTQRTLLENLGYRLLPLWQHTIILEALEDMERAGRQQNSPELRDRIGRWDDDNLPCFGTFRSSGLDDERAMSSGKAVVGFGQQMTPTETPVAENIKGTRDVLSETREAFQHLDLGCLEFPDTSTVLSHPFTAYVDSTRQELELGMAWGV